MYFISIYINIIIFYVSHYLLNIHAYQPEVGDDSGGSTVVSDDTCVGDTCVGSNCVGDTCVDDTCVDDICDGDTCAGDSCVDVTAAIENKC